MRAFTAAVRGAAIGLLMASCTGNPGTSTDSTTSSSSASSGGAGGAGGSTPEDIIRSFCNTMAAPLCETDAACCPDWHYQYIGLRLGLDVCEKNLADYIEAFPFCHVAGGFDVSDLKASLEAGTTVFNQAALDACLAELKALSAGGAACTVAPKRIGGTNCLNTFQGQIPPGGACSWNETVWRDTMLPCKDGNCENGVCVAFAKIGEPCTISPFDHSVTSAMHCNATKGEVCWGPPDGGGTGGGGGGSAFGTCKPRGKIGDPCDPGNYWECESYLCDPATSKCAFPDMTSVCSGEF